MYFFFIGMFLLLFQLLMSAIKYLQGKLSISSFAVLMRFGSIVVLQCMRKSMEFCFIFRSFFLSCLTSRNALRRSQETRIFNGFSCRYPGIRVENAHFGHKHTLSQIPYFYSSNGFTVFRFKSLQGKHQFYNFKIFNDFDGKFQTCLMALKPYFHRPSSLDCSYYIANHMHR